MINLYNLIKKILRGRTIKGYKRGEKGQKSFYNKWGIEYYVHLKLYIVFCLYLWTSVRRHKTAYIKSVKNLVKLGIVLICRQLYVIFLK